MAVTDNALRLSLRDVARVDSCGLQGWRDYLRKAPAASFCKGG